MKFYYNGKLIRTSKTKHYTHACVNKVTGNAINCSTTYDGAFREKGRRISSYRESIENCKSAIASLEHGHKYYYAKIGRTTWKEEADGTIEEYKASIKRMEDDIAWVTENWIIVEVEERD